MPQDLSAVKANFISGVATLADKLLLDVNTCDEMAAHYFAMNYNSGAANQIVDGDCTGTNGYLTAALITSAIIEFQAISTAATTGLRNVLRQLIQTPLP